MLSYEVTSERPCLIDGLGELKAGETRTFGEGAARLFEILQGKRLTEARFPSDVVVTVVVDNEQAKEG